MLCVCPLGVYPREFRNQKCRASFVLINCPNVRDDLNSASPSSSLAGAGGGNPKHTHTQREIEKKNYCNRPEINLRSTVEQNKQEEEEDEELRRICALVDSSVANVIIS